MIIRISLQIFHHPLNAALIALAAGVSVIPAKAADTKPNIVIIWGDDIGQSDVSAYSKGMMGFKTPNIDRIANEGMIFTDYYGEQSCTPPDALRLSQGRACFVPV